MRPWILAIAVVAACKSGKDKDTGLKPATVAASAPKVGNGALLASGNDKPPFLLLVDEAGSVRLAAAKTWADLDANTLTIAAKSGKLDPVRRFVREEYMLGRDPIEA